MNGQFLTIVLIVLLVLWGVSCVTAWPRGENPNYVGFGGSVLAFIVACILAYMVVTGKR